ncbi:MAG: hypothetical protein J6R80_00625 [Kiritimatiellae bacterium]|nr:hypothetical protein [Kiritimatiellia bacterium]
MAAVLALLCAAALLATPKGRLPLALRGLAKITGRREDKSALCKVPLFKRLLALLLVLAAVILCLVA